MDDHDRSVSFTSCSVQLFTVPTLVGLKIHPAFLTDANVPKAKSV